MISVIDHALASVRTGDFRRVEGTVASLRGLTLEVSDLPVAVGSVVEVRTASGDRPAEVVGFEGTRAIIMMLGQTGGVRVGDRVGARHSTPTIGVGSGLLGRVVNGLCEPVDEGVHPVLRRRRPMQPAPVPALRRGRISGVLGTGVRAIDGFATIGRGQRVGIFAGPGVGKSTLLGMVAKRAESDVNVIALIGERGREVREFIEDTLGEEGLARSVVVVATSDESAIMRVRAAWVAASIAEHFRDEGNDVLFVLDSVTRFAHAQRQIGLAVGEPPASKGYTPSVFARLPELLERAGAVEAGHDGARPGSITGLYTILVEGDDLSEPISDAVRGILDGHVMLSRALAQRGHFPAIDVLDSVSRVAPLICDEAHEESRRLIQRLMAAHAKSEDLIQIGAYASGSDPDTDTAIALKGAIDAMLRQSTTDHTAFDEGVATLQALADQARTMLAVGAAQRAPVGVPGASA